MESRIDNIVKRTLDCGFTLRGTRNLTKKKKSRLRKSLIKQVKESLSIREETDEHIVRSLGDQLLRKYGSSQNYQSQHSTAQTHTYHADLDLYITDSDEDDEEGINKNEVLTSEDQQQQTNAIKLKNVKISKLKEENENLEFKLQRSKRALSNQRTLCEDLMDKNQFLSLRSKELTRIKVSPCVSPRAILIADNALFSDFYGYVDQLLSETEVSFCEGLSSASVFNFSIHKTTNSHEICKAVLENGEMVILKTIKRSLKQPKKRCFSRVAYEAKILKLVGKHENIVQSYGISVVKNVPALILSFESYSNLEQILQNNKIAILPIIVYQILSGICKGISHLHSRDILHNNITTQNICLKNNLQCFVPILIGFSCSCRLASAKPLTNCQCEQIKDSNHLPPKVKAGIMVPSKVTDIYSFGRIAQKVCCFISNENFEKKGYEVAYQCLNFIKNPLDFEASVLIELDGFKYTDEN